MKKKIVAFGEVVWDNLPGIKVLGGTPANLVYRCNSFGEEGHLLSRVGDDEPGRKALLRLQELGISAADVQIDPEFPTGTVEIIFDEHNEPVFQVIPDVAFDHIEFSAEALKLVRNADCLFFGLLPQRYGISKNTLRELIRESPNSLKFFDLKLFRHFFNAAVVENLLKSSHIVRIKEKEIGILGRHLNLKPDTLEEFGRQLIQKYQVDLVLITRGPGGVFAFHKDQGPFYDRGYDIELKDNIGSGMAFSAGFLHCFLQGKSIRDSLNFGNAAGALNATKTGATSEFSKDEVLTFIKQNSTGLQNQP